MAEPNPPQPSGDEYAREASTEASAQGSTMDMLRGLAHDVANYVRDLAQLFTAELREKARSLRREAAMAAAALLILFFSLALLSAALVGVVAYALASWRWSLLIVGVAYAIVGALLLLPLARGLHTGLFRFRHTTRHLREDRDWAKRKRAA